MGLGHRTTVHAAAVSLYRAALLRTVAVSPARRPKLWARAEHARQLAEALGVPAEEINTVTLTVGREP